MLLNLVLVEIGNAIDNHPRERAAKVDEFVHQKGHDTGGEYIVANVGVPRHPQLLKVIEVYIVLGHLFELVPIRVGCVRESVLENGRRVAMYRSELVFLKDQGTKGRA
jgi:hypothetical protein